MHMAIAAPIEVPQIKSKQSRTSRPTRASIACSSSVGLRPLTPPPSIHRMRSGRPERASRSERSGPFARAL
eukprot:4202878-Pleurochrysis_carterae.AAC.1